MHARVKGVHACPRSPAAGAWRSAARRQAAALCRRDVLVAHARGPTCGQHVGKLSGRERHSTRQRDATARRSNRANSIRSEVRFRHARPGPNHLVAHLPQFCDRSSRIVGNRGAELHLAPVMTPFFDRCSRRRAHVNSELRPEHVDDIFKAGPKSMPTDREMEVSKSRSQALRRSLLVQFSSACSARLKQLVGDRIMVEVHVVMRCGDVGSSVANVVDREQRPRHLPGSDAECRTENCRALGGWAHD